MTTFIEFAKLYGVTMTTSARPKLNDSPRSTERYHFTVTLHCDGRAESFDFWHGSAHVEKRVSGKWQRANIFGLRAWTESSIGFCNYRPTLPDLGNVLYCLASDSRASDYRFFEDWAGDFGYETDSREAEHIYRQCLDQARKLRDLFGATAFEHFLNCEEDD